MLDLRKSVNQEIGKRPRIRSLSARSRVRALCSKFDVSGVETCVESGPEGMGQLPWSRALYRARNRVAHNRPL